jgi:predicted membrane-bound spermidine synthase
LRIDSGGTRYEVRSHGATRRLFSDGVFHSAWNPRTGLTGRAWDLLLAAAFAPVRRPRRILVLGAGAGTILLQYRRFIDPVALVAVDRDPLHLEIGYRHFGLGDAAATIHLADARDWVAGWTGPAFDLVVEDLYGHRAGAAERAVPVDRAWVKTLSRLVAPGGALVANFTSLAALKSCAPVRFTVARAGYPSGFMLRGPLDHNAVALFCRERTTPAAIRARLREVPGLDDRRRGCRLRYQARTLW